MLPDLEAQVHTVKTELERLTNALLVSDARSWIADAALERLPRGYMRLAHQQPGEAAKLSIDELRTRMSKTLRDAHAAVDAYCIKEQPRREDISTCPYRRSVSGVFLDLQFAEAEPSDVEELLCLLAVVPFETLLNGNNGRIWLNPSFGEVGRSFGGADADLVIGDILVDVKVTKDSAIKDDYIRQLIGYFLLWRDLRADDPNFLRYRVLACILRGMVICGVLPLTP